MSLVYVQKSTIKSMSNAISESNICSGENKEICLEDVYKLLLTSTQDISKKIDGIERNLLSIEQKYDFNIVELKQKVEVLETENSELKKRLTNIERKAKRRNLIIYGVAEQTEEKVVDIVVKLFEQSLKIKVEKFDIVNAFRIGKYVQQSRPILIELFSDIKKYEILKNRQKLKGTKIFISEDLIPEDRKQRKFLVEHLKEARSKNKSAVLRGNKLIIDGEAYDYNDLAADNENNDCYSSPQTREVLSAPPTPSACEDRNDTDFFVSTQFQTSSRQVQNTPSAVKSYELPRETVNNRHHQGTRIVGERVRINSETEEKKRKFETSPNQSNTGAVPKVPRTRSVAKTKK